MSTGHEVLAVGTSAVAEFSERKDNGTEQTCAQVFVRTTGHVDGDLKMTRKSFLCKLITNWTEYLRAFLHVDTHVTGL